MISRLTFALLLLAATTTHAQSVRVNVGVNTGFRGYGYGGYSAYRSYGYGGYGYRGLYTSPGFVGSRYSGYYPNTTARYHYTGPRITTGQGYYSGYRGTFYRGYGYPSYGRSYGGFGRGGYGYGGFGGRTYSPVPRYYYGR